MMTPTPTAAAAPKRYTWTKLLDIPRGHRFFKESASGAIAIADRSGGAPDSTDDGVLWVDRTRELRLSLGDYASLSVPVTKERDTASPQGYWVGCSLTAAPSIVQLLGMQVRSGTGWAEVALVAHLNSHGQAKLEEGSDVLLHLPSASGTRDLRVAQPTVPGSAPAVAVTVGTAFYSCEAAAARRIAAALHQAADKAEALKR